MKPTRTRKKEVEVEAASLVIIRLGTSGLMVLKTTLWEALNQRQSRADTSILNHPIPHTIPPRQQLITYAQRDKEGNSQNRPFSMSYILDETVNITNYHILTFFYRVHINILYLSKFYIILIDINQILYRKFLMLIKK